MLDDLQAAFQEAKEELAHNLELVSCLKEENQTLYQKECLNMYNAWHQKWFGT